MINPIETSSLACYPLYGLCIASYLPLGASTLEATTADVVIRYGDVPGALAEPRARGVLYQATPKCFLFTLDSVARYLVSEGKEIVIDPAPEAEAESVSFFLLTSPLAALLHQRGLMVLHGSAVVVNGEAVVFVGESGAGKSTLAAALGQRGYSILADDISVVSLDGQGRPWVYPGEAAVKLWQDAAEKMGLSAQALRPIGVVEGKYWLPVEPGPSRQAVPLRRLYLLDQTNTPGFEWTLLKGFNKLVALTEQIYRGHFLAGLGNLGVLMQQYTTLAQQVAVCRVRRPLEPFRLEELVAGMEADWSA